MAEAGFDVGAWLARHPGNTCGSVHVSRPQQLGAWTKAAAAANGGGGGGGGTSGSSGGSRYLYGDTSGLLPFIAPRLPASLNGGGYIPKEAEEDVGVETVIRAAAAAGARLADCDVLTFRNNLNKMFGTPFDTISGWAVDACWLPAQPSSATSPAAGAPSAAAAAGAAAPGAAATGRASGSSSSEAGPGGSNSSGSGSGTLFLDIVKLEQQWAGDPADQERFTRWGYRFEAMCTGQAVADASSEYGVLVRARIAQHRIFLGAEVDCFDPSRITPTAASGAAAAAGAASAESAAAASPAASMDCGSDRRPAAADGIVQQQQSQQSPQQQLDSYIELKTYRLPGNPHQQRTLHKFKHPKWWLQSFLAGVPGLALGGRDDQGTIHRVDLVATADLPRLSAQGGAAWSANQCLQFGAEVLAWMRREAQRRPGRHLRFCYAGGAPGGGGGEIRCTPVEGGQLAERLCGCLQACGLAA